VEGDNLEILGTETISAFVSDKRVIFATFKYQIGKILMEAAGSLRFICSLATDLNHIDLEVAREKGIEIISPKGDYRLHSDRSGCT
jgi:lactate dehydrogenase-like 2-hydroxyacid dehydrogenase